VRGTLRGGSPLKLVQRIDYTGGIMNSVTMISNAGNPSLFIDIAGRPKPELVRE